MSGDRGRLAGDEGARVRTAVGRGHQQGGPRGCPGSRPRQGAGRMPRREEVLGFGLVCLVCLISRALILVRCDGLRFVVWNPFPCFSSRRLSGCIRSFSNGFLVFIPSARFFLFFRHLTPLSFFLRFFLFLLFSCVLPGILPGILGIRLYVYQVTVTINTIHVDVRVMSNFAFYVSCFISGMSLRVL